jgi:transposase-like protein
MTGKRKRYSAEFKAKVALEALRGELTTAQLATKHGVHQTMISEWKRQAVDGLASIFSSKAEKKRAFGKETWRSCTPKLANWLWNGIFWPKPPVDEHRAETYNG